MYIYINKFANLEQNAIGRLPYLRSGDGQGQDAVFVCICMSMYMCIMEVKPDKENMIYTKPFRA